MGILLDPGAGGRSIGKSALNNGDLIVSTVKGSIVSTAIRIASMSVVSHSLLYIGWGQVVEAIAAGVTMRSLGEAIEKSTLAVVYRHPDIDETQALRIGDFAGNQIGKAYNYVGVAQQGVNKYCILTGKISCAVATRVINLKHDTFFCSEIIWAAYQSIDVPLSSTAPNWSKPADIPNLQLKKELDYVGHR